MFCKHLAKTSNFLMGCFLLLASHIHAYSVTTRTYDPYGNLEQIIDPRGLATQFQFDPLNRLEHVTYADGKTVQYSYDLSGVRIKTQDSHGVTSFEPDEFGRIKKVSFPEEQSVSYCYDPQGNLVKMIYPDGAEVEYAYDLSGRLIQVKDPSGITRLEYDESSNTLKRKTLPNGVSTEYLYHPSRKVSNVTHTMPGGGLIEEFRYEYDRNGNRIRIEKITPQETETTLYTYDKLNRIKKAEYPSGFFEAFEYDGAGNRLRKTTPFETTSYEYDDENRLTKAGKTLFLYDLAGNLIEKSSSSKKSTYTYDAANRLISYTDDANKVAFEYDGDGNRTAKIVNGVRTEYVNDLVAPISQVLLKRVKGNWWRSDKTIRYVYGGSRISQSAEGNTQFYLYDSIGRNVSDLIDSSGKILNRYSYDAFGAIVEQDHDVRNVYGFSGEQFDEETGLIFLRNRYYDPEIGRFISKDSRPGRLENPQTLNPYSYVENNPVNFVDPLGFEAVEPEKLECVILHINDLPGWFGGQGPGGHAWLELPERNTSVGNYPGGSKFDDYKHINSNTTSFKFHVKSPLVANGLEVMDQIEWSRSTNCVYTAVEGLKAMGCPEAEKTHLSKFLPLPSELRSQMLQLHGHDPRIVTYPRERTILSNVPPPPSLGSAALAGFDYGGVSLSKAAEIALEMSDVTGATVDPATGQIILFGPQDRRLPPMDIDDLTVAVRSLYGIGVAGSCDPGVSIGTEPSPIPGQMKVRYDGSTANTAFGSVMFEADRLLKCLCLGKDNLTGLPLTSKVPGYLSLPERAYAHHKAGSFNYLLWFTPDQIVLLEAENHQSLLFGDVRMKLIAPPEPTEPSPVHKAAEEFAQHFTEHYDEFAQEHPILGTLKNLGKITAVVKWLRDHHIPFDTSFFAQHSPEEIPTPSYTPAIQHTLEWVEETKEKRKVKGHKHKQEVVVKNYRSMTIRGGISYLLDKHNFGSYQDSLADTFADAALTSRPSENTFSWSFRSPIGHETLLATAQTLYRTRKPGNVNRHFYDMSFAIPGNRTLSLQRFYNSFCTQRSSLGYGWRFVPYELELPLEKAEISLDADFANKLVTYPVIFLKTPEGETFYELYGLDELNRPLFKSSGSANLLRENADGTFILKVHRLGIFHFNARGQIVKELDPRGFSIDYEYDGPMLIKISDGSGAAITLEYKKGLLARATGPGGIEILYAHDENGLLRTVEEKDGHALCHFYDTDKRLIKIEDSLHRILFEAEYDDYNRAVFFSDGLKRYHTEFSQEKKTMKFFDELGETTLLEFDQRDRLIRRQDSGGLTWQFVYGQEGIDFPTKVIDPRGHITESRYDPSGNLIDFKNAVGAAWHFIYDDIGNVIAQKNPNGRTIVHLFSENNLLSQSFFKATLHNESLFPLGGFSAKGSCSMSFRYEDSTGMLKASSDMQNATTYYEHNRQGLLTRRTLPTGYDVFYDYGDAGELLKISDAFSKQKAYTYDLAYRIKTVKTPFGTILFDYSEAGDLQAVTNAEGFVMQYDYDARHFLRKVVDSEGKTTEYEHSSDGRLKKATLPNGSTMTIEWDRKTRTVRETYGSKVA